MRPRPAPLAALLLITLGGRAAFAQQAVYDQSNPFDSWLGLNGFDVSNQQSVGVRFTPAVACDLYSVAVWFMSNDFSGSTFPPVTMSLRPDLTTASGSIPSTTIIEQWSFNITALGWDPVHITKASTLQPRLSAGQKYWIVCQSSAPGGLDGVWNWATDATGFTANTNGGPNTWQPGGSGAVSCLTVNATLPPPPCRPDLDHDGHLTSGDYLDFLLAFGAGEPAAEFDGDGALSSGDYFQFLLEFASGC